MLNINPNCFWIILSGKPFFHFICYPNHWILLCAFCLFMRDDEKGELLPIRFYFHVL